MKGFSEETLSLPQEQQAIGEKCRHPTGRFIEFKLEETEQSAPDRFEQQVRLFPDRTAVKTKTHHLTYDQLNRAANRVARAILERRGLGTEPVALLIEPGATQLIAMLGVLKAGKIMAALDPSYPRERIAYTLQDSQATLILTNDANYFVASDLAEHDSVPLNIDHLAPHLDAENLGLAISPDTLSHILYTSGSTGQPKGVVHNHRNLLHQNRNFINTFHICAEDRVTLLTSVTGQAMNVTFCALLSGAALYPMNVKEEGVAPLADWLAQDEITIYMSGSPLFRNFTETLTGQQEFPRLRLIRLSSQTVFKSDIDLYKAHFPADCVFASGLSTSETGRILNYFVDKVTQIATSSVPVGFPHEGKEVQLLGEDGNEVGLNQLGEIAVRSRYLARGYWGKPELTRESFQPDPAGGDRLVYRLGDLGRRLPDGCLEILGRKDFQVKIRGNRVEVTEVETRLMGLDAVREAIVVAREDPSGNHNAWWPISSLREHGSPPSPNCAISLARSCRTIWSHRPLSTWRPCLRLPPERSIVPHCPPPIGPDRNWITFSWLPATKSRRRWRVSGPRCWGSNGSASRTISWSWAATLCSLPWSLFG
jgi:amino acid adenylation domain-containing protein